jgi:hypothetical protein
VNKNALSTFRSVFEDDFSRIRTPSPMMPNSYNPTPTLSQQAGGGPVSSGPSPFGSTGSGSAGLAASSSAPTTPATRADLPIVRLFGILETADAFALELELMQPVDLYDRLASQGVMNEIQAQQVLYARSTICYADISNDDILDVLLCGHFHYSFYSLFRVTPFLWFVNISTCLRRLTPRNSFFLKSF